MESSKKPIGKAQEEKRVAQEDKPAKVIEWEDYEQELARLCSLTSALEEAKRNKLMLEEKLRSFIRDSSRSLAGERGYGHLRNLQKLLRMRQQYMVSQVSLLYPVKLVIRKTPEQELESFRSSIKPGVPDGSKPVDQGTLTILGLHLSVIPFTKMSFFTDKEEVQQSSTALGYVAHAASLIASYLQVPLRYPPHLGGSRSYICDYSPSVEHSASSTSLDSEISTSTKPVEFPLFIEGQDTTRTAYAVFLLNKDLEQLLNFIGSNSIGPRHILANLKELKRTILSPEYNSM